MKRHCRIVIALVILGGLSGLILGQDNLPAFTVRLPRDINPETVRIDILVRGKGFWRIPRAIQTRTLEYAIPFRYGNSAKAFEVGDAQSLSLFIYAPGYQAIQREFLATELKTLRVYEVVLKRQQTTVLQGLLVDTQSRPLAGQSIRLNFNPGCDNPDCLGNPMEVARTMTRIDGTFQVDVPLVGSDDALFYVHNYDTSYSLTADIGTLRPPDPASRNASVGWFQFAPERAYPAPMTVMRIVPGQISGKLGPLFLKQNQLPERLKSELKNGRYSVEIELKNVNGGTRNIRPGEDGRFQASALPGTYNLNLHVVRGGTSMDIRIADGIVIEEGQEKVIQIP